MSEYFTKPPTINRDEFFQDDYFSGSGRSNTTNVDRLTNIISFYAVSVGVCLLAVSLLFIIT